MRKLILLLLLLLSQLNFGQGAEYQDIYPPDVIMPKFKDGGLDVFYDYVNKNFDFSKVTKPGTMVTAFTVDEFGEIKNIRVIQFASIEAATEIIRVLKSAPKWKPALRGGNPFSVAIRFPLNFKEKEAQVVKPLNVIKESDVNNQDSLSVSNKTIKVDDLNENDKQISSKISKFNKFLHENYRPPNTPGLKGKVIVSFVVNEDGSLSDFIIVKDLGHGSAEELIRVLKKSSGKWTPAVKDGKPVKTKFTLPVSINNVEED
jgi:hypothetical protein